MYHSIKIDGIDCYSEWGLIPDGRVHVVPPSVKTKVVEIPGSNGTIDLTTSLTGYPLYGNREGSFNFFITRKGQNYNWVTLNDKLLKVIHGRKIKVILEDDPEYYYVGRCTLGEWTEGRPYDTISLNYVFEPYKWNLMNNIEQFPDVEWTKTINSGTEDGYSDLANYLNDAPISPIIKIENTGGDIGTVGFSFKNEELGIDVDTRLPVGVQKCPLFTMTNMSGENVISLVAKDPCRLTLSYRNGKL